MYKKKKNKKKEINVCKHVTGLARIMLFYAIITVYVFI